jgi:hypothetical protein
LVAPRRLVGAAVAPCCHPQLQPPQRGRLPAINTYRQSLVAGTPIPPPAPNVDCPPTFGNTDIFGGSYADPS